MFRFTAPFGIGNFWEVSILFEAVSRAIGALTIITAKLPEPIVILYSLFVEKGRRKQRIFFVSAIPVGKKQIQDIYPNPALTPGSCFWA